MSDMIERLREAVRTLDHDISCEMGATPSTDEEMEKHGWYMLQAGDMTSPPDDLRRKHRQELLDELIAEATKGRKGAQSMMDSDSHLRWFFAQDWVMTKKELEAE